MKIVIAPDSFKESLTALQAVRAIEEGVRVVFPDADYVACPMSDGGEGTAEAAVDAANGKLIHEDVKGPLGETVHAHYGLLDEGRTAIIEMAQPSGLMRVPREQRNPLVTSTYGTGQLILSALDRGATKIVVGVGGSATCDGGTGALSALGFQFIDRAGNPICGTGEELSSIVAIDTSGADSRLRNVQFVIASDVDNPLTGPHGAAPVYAPQKGATPEQVEQLNAGLENLAQKIQMTVHRNVTTLKGAGAAGGLAAGLMAFLDAELRSGAEVIAELVGLDAALHAATICITGEGAINSQTLRGKTVLGVAKAASIYNVPVVAITGSLGQGYEALLSHHVAAVFSLVPGPVDLDDAMLHAPIYLSATAEQVARTLKIGINI